MGWEVELNAIPADCELIAAVKRQEIDAELLICVRGYFRLRRKHSCRVDSYTQGDPDYEILVDYLERIMVDHPDIQYRFCDLQRRFDWLKWLLEQCSEGDDPGLATTAIGGEVQVTPTARSTQGFPICWTSPETCKRIHAWLSELTPADLQAQFDPDRMDRATLYKWVPPVDAVRNLDWIVKDFEALKQFYADVAKRSEAVLVVAD